MHVACLFFFRSLARRFGFEYGFQEEVERKCDYGGCENVGKDLCEDCGYSLCDICFGNGKGRAIWSDTKKCGDCDERGNTPEDEEEV